MTIDRTAGVTGGQPNPLREALSGSPMERTGQTQQMRPSDRADSLSIAEQLEATLRQNNDNFRQVQQRILTNEMTMEALGQIQEEIQSMRSMLRNLPPEGMDLDLVSQTINNIDRLSDTVRFENVPLLDDFSAESLGLTRIIAPDQDIEQVGQALQNGISRAEERLDEVRQEDAIDRQQLNDLEVSRENITAALATQRANRQEDMQQAAENVRQDIPQRGGGDVNLTPDRVMDLI